jgi:serine protease Do
MKRQPCRAGLPAISLIGSITIVARALVPRKIRRTGSSVFAGRLFHGISDRKNRYHRLGGMHPMRQRIPCLALIFAIFAAPAGPVWAQNAPNPGDAPAPNILEEYDHAFARVVERAMPAVVEIDVNGFGPPEDDSDSKVIERQSSLGSGVIVDPSGYIMTNNHVVAGAQRIQVVLSPATMEMKMGGTSLLRHQRTYPAKLIGTSRITDLALIKIEANDLPTIPLPPNFVVHLGQTILAIGAPEGLDHTVTHGIVSAVGRQPNPDRPMVYIQTDAPINPGNSGGPLVDRDGNLIGINTFILTQGGGSEGLGFAIPQPVVRFVYQELRAHGHVRPLAIGANTQTVTPSMAAGLKLPQDWGVILSDIVPGGPADRAGLRRKDIVVAFDGRPIDSLPKFSALLYLHSRELPIHMDILRGAESLKITVTPAEVRARADSLVDLIHPDEDLIAPLGLFVVELNEEASDLIGSPRSKSGLVVAAMLENEPPVYADLSAGDIIRYFNDTPMQHVSDLRSALAGLKAGDSVVLEVERGGVLRYVAFNME